MDSLELPLDRMTLEEKLMAMEAIWDSLCRDETQIPVPDWHKQILDERERKVARPGSWIGRQPKPGSAIGFRGHTLV